VKAVVNVSLAGTYTACKTPENKKININANRTVFISLQRLPQRLPQRPPQGLKERQFFSIIFTQFPRRY
jgi:hypothetical protein